jgi:hypothetical protein
MATNHWGEGNLYRRMAAFITPNHAILPFTEEFVGFPDSVE